MSCDVEKNWDNSWIWNICAQSKFLWIVDDKQVYAKTKKQIHNKNIVFDFSQFLLYFSLLI